MSQKLFGTDGIRGVANDKLSPELAFQIGQGAGRYLVESQFPLSVVVGRDTRLSGTMLGAALASGLCSAGVRVSTLGVAPTGAISWITRTGAHSLGVVISASHNPAPDNGIKLIASDGRKIADDVERRIEELCDVPFIHRPMGGGIGSIQSDPNSLDAYTDFLMTLAPEGLGGMRVAVDGANGSAYEMGASILLKLGADVTAIGNSPDGMNINADGGATKPQTIQDLTVSIGADIGVAFDGDADRAVFSDSKGRLINGDRMMGIWASHKRTQGLLSPAIVVGTVMSNGGFQRYLSSQGIALERAAVGDKYVSQQIDATGAHIGGEQSGHIIFPAHGPTGDGLVTAIELLRTLKESGRSACEFYDDYQPWPQLLVNVTIDRREGWDLVPGVADAISSSEALLNGRGRVNVRPSGTQPMIRVMVEADEIGLRDESAQRIVDAMAAELGGKIYSRVDLTYALGD